MRILKPLVLATVLALPGVALLAQQVRTIVLYTSGFGAATESDRSASLQEATDNATNQANAICTGTVTATNTTGSFCLQTGPDDNGNSTYSCTATVKARCEIEYRGR